MSEYKEVLKLHLSTRLSEMSHLQLRFAAVSYRQCDERDNCISLTPNHSKCSYPEKTSVDAGWLPSKKLQLGDFREVC